MRRPLPPLGPLALAAIWILATDPLALFAPGAQLSFVATVALGLGLSWVALLGLAAGISRLYQAESMGLDQAESMALGSAPTGDGMTFALVALLMVGVGLAATFFPAWRTTRANPLAALRHL